MFATFGKGILKDKSVASNESVLSQYQAEAIRILAKSPGQQAFRWAGGTALAENYLKHRRSNDLDFFTGQHDVVEPFSYSVERTFAQMGWKIEVVRRFPTFVQMMLTAADGSEVVRLDLALVSPFQLEPNVACDFGVSLTSYRDLIADKTLAFFGRAEPRDAVDLYFILRREPVAVVLDLAKQKDAGFDTYWFAGALTQIRELPDELPGWGVMTIVPFDPVDLKRLFAELAESLFDAEVKQRTTPNFDRGPAK